MYGVTFDQLRYWDRKGVLVPERAGLMRVYTREHLLRLTEILRLMKQGWSVQKIGLWYELRNAKQPQSVPSTRDLEYRIKRASRGSVIREPLPSKNAYNSVYVRLMRKIRQVFPDKKVGRGRDVEIRLSDDEMQLEAHFIR